MPVRLLSVIPTPAIPLPIKRLFDMRYPVFRITLGFAMCCLAGCGPSVKVTDVSGTVTYNGKPPNEEGCSIVFVGYNGKQVTAKIAATGEYKASGVVAGANKVAVYYRSPESAKTREPGEKVPPSESLLHNLPLKFADVQTSGLTFDTSTGTEYSPDLKGTDLGSQPPKPPKRKDSKGKGKPHKDQ
jgi:hypothetical protein